MTDENFEKIDNIIQETIKKQNISLISHTYKAVWKQVLHMLNQGKTKKELRDYANFVLNNSEKVEETLLTKNKNSDIIKEKIKEEE